MAPPQISLAGGRGADAYERAVAEGREIPSLSSRVLGNMETRYGWNLTMSPCSI